MKKKSIGETIRHAIKTGWSSGPTVWIPENAWTRAAPNVSKKLQIAKSKKKRVVSRAKALDLQAEYNAFRSAAVKKQVKNSKRRAKATATKGKA